jgi:hypothetical protein
MMTGPHGMRRTWSANRRASPCRRELLDDAVGRRTVRKATVISSQMAPVEDTLEVHDGSWALRR